MYAIRESVRGEDGLAKSPSCFVQMTGHLNPTEFKPRNGSATPHEGSRRWLFEGNF
jgi:hypothetical protein